MKKFMTYTVLGGMMCAAFVLSGPGTAVPFAPDVVVAQAQVETKPDTQAGPVEGDDGQPVIQVALLLDTSGSMSSLIDQAKTELWSIVNKLGEARYQGKVPKVEVALFEYGKSSLERESGYIQQLSPFTNDLDGLSETLFALQTNGGDEYCAWVIRSSIDSLKWKHRKGSLKMIFIAGNEPFTQGPVEVGAVMKEAEDKGILVHPILCAAGGSNDEVSWSSAAEMAHTDLKTIDHTRVVRVPKTPYDDEIAKLGSELNNTYLGYGSGGRAKKMRQEAQDVNMQAVSAPAAAERSVTKASSNYHNEEWDVVDRAKTEGGLTGIRDEELPEEMKGMTESERESFVAEKSQERTRIQKRIQDLSVKRKDYIAKDQKENGEADATLGNTVVTTVRAKAKKDGFEI